MFTGIVEEIGKIKTFKKENNGAIIEVKCKTVLQDTKIGDSIAINGVCQTVTKISTNSFCANVSDETLAVTNFDNLKNGDSVHLPLIQDLADTLYPGTLTVQENYYQLKSLQIFIILSLKFRKNKKNTLLIKVL